jgi:SiaC family regulatory phosphoprotein
MEILNIEGAEDTPKIILNKQNGIFEISGRSLPEDSAEFYRPVLEWIAEYAKSPNPSTEFTLKLEYFNTASSKLILDVLSALEDIKGMKILWYFHEDDEDMEEAGEEFSELVEIPFEFKTY